MMNLATTAHGINTLSLESASNQKLKDQYGNYCYLFPELAKQEALKAPFGDSDEAYFVQLQDFGRALNLYGDYPSNSSDIPAVYTYFGQFINHDMSAAVGIKGDLNFGQGKLHMPGAPVITPNPNLIPLTAHTRQGNPDAVVAGLANEHAFPLSLNSLYGGGSQQLLGLYENDTASFKLADAIFDPTLPQDQRKLVNNVGKSTRDIPRDSTKKIALIADRRNDENLITSQLHLAFMLFHNKVVAKLKTRSSPPVGEALFKEARALVTKHYQWCILHDYLERIAPGNLALTRGRVAQPKSVPLEMTTAAFRFGHSMISAAYDYNEVFGLDEGCQPAVLHDLFMFTSSQGMNRRDDIAQLPNHWIIDWKRFLAERPKKLMADKIDPLVTAQMAGLLEPLHPVKEDDGLSSIVMRNLQRGFHRFIPSGQALCKKIFGDDFSVYLLDAQKIRSCFLPAEMDRHGQAEAFRFFLGDDKFGGTTPAWLYFLCEARHFGEGNALGPTAAAIVTQTIEGLIRNSPDSVLKGNWKPEDSPIKNAGDAPIKDIKGFLRYAGVMS
jgi:Animal haem peroxidase